MLCFDIICWQMNISSRLPGVLRLFFVSVFSKQMILFSAILGKFILFYKKFLEMMNMITKNYNLINCLGF